MPDQGSFGPYQTMTTEYFNHAYRLPRRKEQLLGAGSSQDFYASGGMNGRANGQLVIQQQNVNGSLQNTTMLVLGSVEP